MNPTQSMPFSKKKKTSVGLSYDLLDRLRAQADKHHWNLSQLIRIGLEEMVAAMEEDDKK
jgi:hypothetical protein